MEAEVFADFFRRVLLSNAIAAVVQRAIEVDGLDRYVTSWINDIAVEYFSSPWPASVG